MESPFEPGLRCVCVAGGGGGGGRRDRKWEMKFHLKISDKFYFKENRLAYLGMVTGTNLCCVAWRWRKRKFVGD